MVFGIPRQNTNCKKFSIIFVFSPFIVNGDNFRVEKEQNEQDCWIFWSDFGKIFKAESVFSLDKQVSQQVPKVRKP